MQDNSFKKAKFIPESIPSPAPPNTVTVRQTAFRGNINKIEQKWQNILSNLEKEEMLIFQRVGVEKHWREEVAVECAYWEKEAKGKGRRGGCTSAKQSEAQMGQKLLCTPSLYRHRYKLPVLAVLLTSPNTHPTQTQRITNEISSISNRSCSQAKWCAFNSSVSLFKSPLVVVWSIYSYKQRSWRAWVHFSWAQCQGPQTWVSLDY